MFYWFYYSIHVLRYIFSVIVINCANSDKNYAQNVISFQLQIKNIESISMIYTIVMRYQCRIIVRLLEIFSKSLFSSLFLFWEFV